MVYGFQDCSDPVDAYKGVSAEIEQEASGDEKDDNLRVVRVILTEQYRFEVCGMCDS